MNNKTILDRTGENKIMNNGQLATIYSYTNTRNISIIFEGGCTPIKCSYKEFNKGAVKNIYSPSVRGFGIVGLEHTRDTDGNKFDSYTTWVSMISRCYSDDYKSKYQSYKYCTVCDEWSYYSVFKKWYDENYYKIEGEQMHLDKDILIKGNKIYSPKTCVFVPRKINNLFTKSNKSRGKFPIGIFYNKKLKKYVSQCNMSNRNLNHIGCFETIEEAFDSYKTTKENYIKEVAEKYKSSIPNNLYKAMCEYKVEITD